MNVIVSLVLYKHEYKDIKKVLNCLIKEGSICMIILIDNGNHCSWLHTFSHEKVKFFGLEVNEGFGAGHNHTFLKYSSEADYFLVCNPDVFFADGEITKLLQFSINNSIDLTIPKILYPDGTLQYSCKLLPTPLQLFLRRFFLKTTQKLNNNYELRRADYDKPFFAPSFSGCCILISQKAVKITKGFDTRFFLYLEDIDLTRRIVDEGLNVSYCPDSTVYHEAQRRSYSNYKFLYFHLVSTIKYFNKWGWFIDKQRRNYNRKCLKFLPRLHNNSSN